MQKIVAHYPKSYPELLRVMELDRRRSLSRHKKGILRRRADMDIAGQKSLIRRIQAHLKRESEKQRASNRYATACDREDQIAGLDCVLTSLEHLENIRAASATIIGEVRDALVILDKGKKP